MCCLFGLLDYGNTLTGKERHFVLSALSKACEVRGTDATGYAFFAGDALTIQKAPKAASKMKFYIPGTAKYIMGHTRMTTQGSEKRNYNNHPFEGKAGGDRFALAHNGVIHNDKRLRAMHHLPKTKIETDSYVAVQLLEHEKSVGFRSLRRMAEALEGTFTLTVSTRDHFYFIKGNNPVCLYHFPHLRIYLYASTEEILKAGLARVGLLEFRYERVEMRQGEIMRVDAHGQRKSEHFDDSNLMDYHYYRALGTYCDYPRSSKNEHITFACEYAQIMGIPEDVLQLLLDAGYDAMDIEEMIYDPELLDCAMSEILCGEYR